MKNTEWIDEASKMYESGMKFYQIANKLGVERKTVSLRLKERGYLPDERYVRKVPVEKLRKYDYSYAEKVFDSIDTEEKAYWLGFLYADGYVSNRSNIVSLALAEEDYDHLCKFRELFRLNDKPLTQKRKKMNGRTYLSYEFSLCDRTIKNQLIALGCIPQKTFEIEFPSDEIVPRELKHHFIRGYFDGDGCVTSSVDSILSVEILGTQSFLEGYQEWVALRENKVHSFKTTSIKHSMYSGIGAVYILDRLYEGATVYLERKHSKYLELRRLRMMSVKRPKSIIAEYSGKGSSQPDPRLKALLDEAARLQQCS